MLSMSAHSTTMEPMHFDDSENPCKCRSTEAVIKHAKDDGEEEVTSKMTPYPKKTVWGVVKEFFQKRRGPSLFANMPPHGFF